MSGWVAGAVAVGGALSYAGSQQAAGAAGSAAEARAQMAQQNRADILGQAGENRRQAMALAEATPQELNSLGQSYDAAGKQLAREERLMAAIDPSLMEASKQALGLLRGETANVNQPMMQMRNQQRNSLMNSLRAQYGPGAESTSIGQRQLNQFDMETNAMFQQNQQSSLGQLFGIATSGAPGANMQRSIAGLQSVGQGYSSLQDRKLSTSLNLGGQTLNALSGTSNAMIDSAGSQFAGDAIRGQGLASLGGNIMNAGTIYGMGQNRAQPTATPSGDNYSFFGDFGSGATQNGNGGGFGANRRLGPTMVE